MRPANYLPKQIGEYIMIKKLGEGSFGEAFKAHKKNNHSIYYALKCVSKSTIKSHHKLKELFDAEISCMKALDHPNCMKLIDFMETINNYYLVLRYCSEGDFNEYLKKKGIKCLPENEAVNFLKQIKEGFKELRKKNIIYRNFKLDNIFIDAGTIAIIGDFGFAEEGFEMTDTALRTPVTMAPEVLLKKKYNSKADLYSIGCCFYKMLYGNYPFFGIGNDNLAKLIETNSGRNLKLPKETIVSSEAEDLLKKLIEFDPIKRIEWNDFFNHPLFNKPSTNNLKIKQLSYNGDFAEATEFFSGSFLAIGHTGAGKSSFINLLDVIQQNIPIKELKKVAIKPSNHLEGNLGSETNPGDQSIHQTKRPANYSFKFTISKALYNINIIDTPGLGDTAGRVYDEEHIDNILNYVSSTSTGRNNKLNGIFLFLNGTEGRFTCDLQYILTKCKILIPDAFKDNLYCICTKVSHIINLPIDTICKKFDYNIPNEHRFKLNNNLFLIDWGKYPEMLPEVERNYMKSLVEVNKLLKHCCGRTPVSTSLYGSIKKNIYFQ